jgi:hypothetical protein
MAIIHDTTMNPGKLDLLTVRVNRVLRPAGPVGQPGLSAAWRLPDGTQIRGILATAEHEPGPRPGDHR